MSTPPWESQSTWISTCRAGTRARSRYSDAVAERGFRLGARRRERGVELVGRRDEPHALPAATCRRLEQHRVADLRGHGSSGVDRCDPVAARHQRHARGAHLVLGSRLVAEPLHHLGRRPDEDEIVVGAGAREVRVLGEEPVAGMNRLAAAS